MIRTERLSIIPLTLKELHDYKRFMRQEEIDYVEQVMDGTYFNTLWIAIAEDKFVAEFNFYGIPNSQGEVEIGVHTREEFEGKGYMTETIKGMLELCRLLGIKSVIGKIDSENKASERVAEKCGFKKMNNIWVFKF